MATTTRPLTLAEFHQLLAAHPDRHLELETDGSVSEEEAASVSLGHSFLQPRLAALLDAQRRGFVFTELNVEWGDRPEYRGDIVFYAAARGPELRDHRATARRFYARFANESARDILDAQLGAAYPQARVRQAAAE